jgi:DNA-binding transcriptional LysR family regulator
VIARRRRTLTLASYARAEHVDVSRRGRVGGAVDVLLARHHLARTVRAVVPDQLAAAVLVAESDLLALVSRRFAIGIARTLHLRVLAPPLPLGAAAVAMAWHPRLDADPAHAWLRAAILRIAGARASARGAAARPDRSTST